MRCVFKEADGTPCPTPAVTTAIVDGSPGWVCSFHNAVISSVIQANRVTGLGAFPKREELDGLVFRSKRNGR